MDSQWAARGSIEGRAVVATVDNHAIAIGAGASDLKK